VGKVFFRFFLRAVGVGWWWVGGGSGGLGFVVGGGGWCWWRWGGWGGELEVVVVCVGGGVWSVGVGEGGLVDFGGVGWIRGIRAIFRAAHGISYIF